MDQSFIPVSGALGSLDLLQISQGGPVLHLRLNRAAKRNALSDTLVQQIQSAFVSLPADVRVVVLSAAGNHFCAGLDLSEMVERDIGDSVLHSRMWHSAFDAIQFGRVPVVAVLHGAVVGGGLELAASCHIRVAESTAYFGLPEGQRGLFVGGGGSVRVSRLMGVARMTDMMLTGRVYHAQEGHQAGLVQYLVAEGEGLAHGIAMAQRIASTAPMSAFAVMHALPRIAEQAPSEGLFTESLMAAVAANTPDAQQRLRAFLDKRAPKVVKAVGSPYAAHPYRPCTIGGCTEATLEHRADGAIVIRSGESLRWFPERLTDMLEHWAREAPDRPFVAKRRNGGNWETITYAQMLERARAVGQALAARGLNAERPIAILSENDLEHLTLAFGAMWAGVPYAPISSAYSLVSQDYGKLRHILRKLTPGLVFASGTAYAKAIAATVGKAAEVVLTTGGVEGRASTPFASMLATAPGREGDAAHAKVSGDTIVKFLFTSGSTKLPKGVVTTNRMLSANQQMIRQSSVFLTETPPVLVDWLPWNHTFGGSHNVGIVLYNGGTLYIDDGKPTPAGIAETLRNLREVPSTVHYNVPKGFEEIALAMDGDTQLRDTFFKDLKAMFFAGAGLSQAVWDHLDRHAVAAIRQRIRMVTGLGMTETSPTCTNAMHDGVAAGHIGLPNPGCEVKLVPVEGKVEIRFRGPHVMPGYWREPELTAEAFDEEGYYRTGDAVKFVDENDLSQGLLFDGRIAEDFKLATGTFVSVGPLRAKVITTGAPYVQDAVVAGMNRDEVGLLIFPRVDTCRALSKLPADAGLADVLHSAPVRALFQDLADKLWNGGTGSANRPARLHVMVELPSIDKGEVTDKGSINQRAVLTHRAALVEALYEGGSSDPFLIMPHKG